MIIFSLATGAMLAADNVNGPARVSIEPRAWTTASAAFPTASIRVDSTLVLLRVSVVDRRNRPVAGLHREHFRLFEDRVEQKIAHVALEDAPLSVGIVFDSSGSMAKRINSAREAVAEFVKLAGREDEFFVVDFSDRPRRLLPWTTDAALIQERLLEIDPGGKTALLDAVYMALLELRRARHGRRMLLVITDGEDNASRYSEREIRGLVREADAAIYAIGIDASAPRVLPESLFGPGSLEEIAELSGGRYFDVDRSRDLSDVATRIAGEIRGQYVLGYTPANRERDGKYRRVQLKLDPPAGVRSPRAYHRPGYYAPAR